MARDFIGRVISLSKSCAEGKIRFAVKSCAEENRRKEKFSYYCKRIINMAYRNGEMRRRWSR